ncbi:MAG: hypothetical protein QOE56_2534 [Solirubrobacterales bacterium]|nr:hypothetical protein [Solirubrobacterales bacterium]
MSFLVQLRKLVLGETWIVPLGVAIAVGAGAVLRELAPGAWDAAGGALLVAAAGAVLLVAVGRAAAARD